MDRGTDRRELLKKIAIGGAWMTPVVQVVMIPSHAAASAYSDFFATATTSSPGTSPEPSDIRLKRDIVFLTRLSSGIGLYRYRYTWSDTLYVGVMAQEVQTIVPEAVVRGADGYLRVNYARLGLRMLRWDEYRDDTTSGAIGIAA